MGVQIHRDAVMHLSVLRAMERDGERRGARARIDGHDVGIDEDRVGRGGRLRRAGGRREAQDENGHSTHGGSLETT